MKLASHSTFSRQFSLVSTLQLSKRYLLSGAPDVWNKSWEDRKRPRLLILGSGWAGTTILKNLKSGMYETILVSPTNYFLFTPLLPEATTGTVESRSLLESIRKIAKGPKAHYFEGKAEDVDFHAKQVLVKDKQNKTSLIPYDKLVIALGARNETYGIPGVVENCFFLKTISDARRIRDKLLQLFEQAAMPTITPEERERLLHFVIVGGGPTGVEFAAELFDFLNQDMIRFFPDLLSSSVKVTLIQGADTILNTFDKAISHYAENRFRRQNIHVVTNSFVVSVEKTQLVYKKRIDGTQEYELHSIPYGMCVWSTGIGMLDITKSLTSRIEAQKHSRCLSVDGHLRVIGVKDAYALGDCASIVTPKVSKLLEEKFNSDQKAISLDTFLQIANQVMSDYPQTSSHVQALIDELTDTERQSFDVDFIKSRLVAIDSKIMSLPATAQVASQQGTYLAKKLNHIGRFELSEWETKEARWKPFRYNHLGNMSYVGGESAVYDSGRASSSGSQNITYSGMGAWVLWRSAYLSRQVSLRTRVLLAWDWTKTFVFGRDISSI